MNLTWFMAWRRTSPSPLPTGRQASRGRGRDFKDEG